MILDEIKTVKEELDLKHQLLLDQLKDQQHLFAMENKRTRAEIKNVGHKIIQKSEYNTHSYVINE